MKIDRVLNLLFYLNRYEKISSKELAEKFEVSQRTIYRDLDILESIGVPIERRQGLDGGVSILENFKIENINFSKPEISRIFSILSNQQYKDAKVELLLEKLKNIVPEGEVEEHRKMDYIKIEKRTFEDKAFKKKLSFLEKQIENRNIVEIEYRDRDGKSSKRILEPYVISFKDYNVYLFAYCCLRNSLRVFKISRIHNMKALNKKYKVREDIIEEIYSQKEFFLLEGTEEIVLKFNRNFFEKVEESLEDFNILSYEEYKNIYNKDLDSESIIIKLNWRIDRWLISYILGLGGNVEVLAPDTLKQRIMEITKDMYNLYYN